MGESLVQVTEGSGKKLHTYSRAIGANTVEDEIVIPGEPYLASYVIAFAGVGTATLDSHIVQIMAGASLNVRIRRIRIQQLALASAVMSQPFLIHRLTTAGTGGASLTPRPYDPSDAAAGATAQTLPSAKGTEGVFLHRFTMGLVAAHPATAFYEWTQLAEREASRDPGRRHQRDLHQERAGHDRRFTVPASSSSTRRASDPNSRSHFGATGANIRRRW